MSVSAHEAGQRVGRIPGELGIWMFIIGDMVMFGLFFTVFVYYRAADVALFSEAQRSLNQTFGALNTLLLLTSSWFVVHAVESARAGFAARTRHLLALAFACGLGFLVIKYFEYGEKIRAGLTITTNDFFMYYFMLTGIHLLHVTLGMGVLAYLWQRLRGSENTSGHVSALESGASFWHMVDILWIVLFALVYLMR
jgi:nitric oxide reductase NorE protein